MSRLRKALNSLYAFIARRYPRTCRLRKDGRLGSRLAGCKGMCSPLPAPGASLAIGGPLTRGRAMNGMSHSAMEHSTVFTSSVPPDAGLWRATMIDGYVELNARSAFSFLEGASLPEELI